MSFVTSFSGDDVAAGSGLAVAVGADVAVGVTEVGTAVAVGSGVGVSASHANIKRIVEKAANAAAPILLDRLVRIVRGFIGRSIPT